MIQSINQPINQIYSPHTQTS